jgi:hypothetical protein
VAAPLGRNARKNSSQQSTEPKSKAKLYRGCTRINADEHAAAGAFADFLRVPSCPLWLKVFGVGLGFGFDLAVANCQLLFASCFFLLWPVANC